MKQSIPPLSRLIRQLRENPSLVLHGQSPAARILTSLGASAVGPLLEAMEPPYPAEQHPVDIIEALAVVLCDLARRNPRPLIDILEQGTVPPNPQLCFVVSALGFGPVDQVLAPLSRALRHPSKEVRWSAARALVKLRTKKAIGPLVKALRDRSTSVKFEVVEAMHASKFFWTSEAIAPLRRIVESSSIKSRAPGLWGRALEVLAKVEARAQGLE